MGSPDPLSEAFALLFDYGPWPVTGFSTHDTGLCLMFSQ